MYSPVYSYHIGVINGGKSITLHGFSLIPRAWSLDAYDLIFKNPKQVIGSYAVTIGMTVIGTSIGLFIIAMTGYALQRPDFRQRNIISFYIYFTTLFQGLDSLLHDDNADFEIKGQLSCGTAAAYDVAFFDNTDEKLHEINSA